MIHLLLTFRLTLIEMCSKESVVIALLLVTVQTILEIRASCRALYLIYWPEIQVPPPPPFSENYFPPITIRLLNISRCR